MFKFIGRLVPIASFLFPFTKDSIKKTAAFILQNNILSFGLIYYKQYNY